MLDDHLAGIEKLAPAKPVRSLPASEDFDLRSSGEAAPETATSVRKRKTVQQRAPVPSIAAKLVSVAEVKKAPAPGDGD